MSFTGEVTKKETIFNKPKMWLKRKNVILVAKNEFILFFYTLLACLSYILTDKKRNKELLLFLSKKLFLRKNKLTLIFCFFPPLFIC